MPRSTSPRDDRREFDERSPLLDADELSADRAHALEGTAAGKLLQDDDPARRRRKTRLYVMVVLLIFLVLVDFGAYLSTTPQAAINERIVCDRYYATGEVQVPQTVKGHLKWGDSGYDCTVAPVQVEVAIVGQVMESLNWVPGILLALPYGILADKIGRKPVVLLSLVGIMGTETLIRLICWFPQIFPLRLIWATPMVEIIGGGSTVVSSMVFVMIADVVDAEDRASAFSFAMAATILSEIFAMPLAARLMNRWSPWVPSLLGLALELVCVPLVLFLLPETMPTKGHDPAGTVDPPSTEAAGEDSDGDMDDSAKTARLAAKFKSVLSNFVKSTSFIFKDANIIILLLTFLVYAFGRQSTSFQINYVHAVFGWSWSKASWLISLRGIATMVVLLLLLPALSALLTRALRLTPASKDIVLARGAMATWMLGTALLGLAASTHALLVAIVLGATSNMVGVAVRSLLTSLVAPSHVATLYTGISLMTGVGFIVAGPVLALTFKAGLGRGGKWVGLPWIFIAACLAVALVGLACVRLRRGGPEERASEGAGPAAAFERYRDAPNDDDDDEEAALRAGEHTSA